MGCCETSHNLWYIALAIYSLFTSAAVLVFYALNCFGEDDGALFLTTPKEQRAMGGYSVADDITPAQWTYDVWWLVYSWQVLWLLYACANVLRHHHQSPLQPPASSPTTTAKPSPTSHPLYSSPYTLPPLLLGLFTIGGGCDVARLFFQDRGYVTAAFVACVMASVLLVLTSVVSFRSLRDCLPRMKREGRGLDVWLVRALVHNGVALHAAWLSFLTLPVLLAAVVTRESGGDVSAVTSSTLALGVVAVGMGVMVVADLTSLDSLCRYMLTPYLALVLALTGMVVGVDDGESFDLGSRNCVLAFILGVLSALCLLLKVGVTLVRHCREK